MTICFADLDGADGLWVPEERTVLVNRRLSEREVAAVIEHELGHVAIDDQHADLDAGVHRPPPARPRRWAAALTAAASLAVVGGVTAGLARGSEGAVRKEPVMAPSAPGLTAPPAGPGEVVQVRVGPDGRTVVVTVTVAAPATATSPGGTASGTATRTASRVPVAPPPVSPQPSGSLPPTATGEPSPSSSPEPAPTTPEVTTPAPTTEVAGVDGTDGAGPEDEGPQSDGATTGAAASTP